MTLGAGVTFGKHRVHVYSVRLSYERLSNEAPVQQGLHLKFLPVGSIKRVSIKVVVGVGIEDG